jgi:predicted SAM-dependent methyltransferase
MTKLHIGCGKDIKHGYENIDLHEGPIKMSMESLKYPSNSVDEILSNHALEHIEHIKTEIVLKEWYRVLKPNGILKFTIPDTKEVLRRWINDDRIDSYWYKALWGQQNSLGQYHYNGFTKKKINTLLIKNGFKIIKLFDYSDYKKLNCIILKIILKILYIFGKKYTNRVISEYPKRKTPSIVVYAKK